MSVGGYTFLELQNEVLDHQLNAEKYREPVKRWLNEGQRQIFLQADIKTEAAQTTVETVSGTATVSLPEDFARLISVHDPDRREPLAPIELRDYDDAPTSVGGPSQYVITGGSVYLYPTPNAAYSVAIRYYPLPQDMVEDGDTPELPVQFHHLLIRYALVRAFERENDYEAANYWREQFMADLLKLRSLVQYDTADGPSQVPGMWEDYFVESPDVLRIGVPGGSSDEDDTGEGDLIFL